jgi:hypothetical protein
MTWKSIVQAFCIFGILAHVFLTANLVAIGYLDFLHLEGAGNSMSKLFHDSLLHAQSTAEPIAEAMESGLSTNRTVTSAVLSTVKLLARISLASLIGYAVLFIHALSGLTSSKAQKT